MVLDLNVIPTHIFVFVYATHLVTQWSGDEEEVV
jgi:hypothetical protein